MVSGVPAARRRQQTMQRDQPRIFSIKSPDRTLALDFCAETGGCITSFRHTLDGRTIDLFRPWNGDVPLKPGNAASFPMTPLTNRIANCELSFEGETFAIRPAWGEEPNYLHGDGWMSAWTVAHHEENRAILTLSKKESGQSPYSYEAKQTFVLEDGHLHLDISITNTGRRLPFGTGHHPYFPRTNKTVMRAALPKVWLCNELMYPTSLVPTPDEWNFRRGVRMMDPEMLPPAHGFRGLDLIDNCFPEWDGIAEIRQPDFGVKIVVTADPLFGNVVIYNPPFDKDFFVFEAVSNIIDGFNLMSRGVADTGTVILDTGATMTGRTSFAIEKLQDTA